MGSYRILSVGQCGFDHARLSQFFRSTYQADIQRADSAADAMQALRSGRNFDLILVNRVFDRDAARGLDLIQEIVAEPALRSVPVMLVSNYPEAQQAAVEAGAREGFGKAELDTPRVRALLDRVLHAGPDAALDSPAGATDSWSHSSTPV